jgi:hypothetical protein
MIQWEYKEEVGPCRNKNMINQYSPEAWLNKFGIEGWELVHIDKQDGHAKAAYLFKRQRSQDQSTSLIR